MKFHTFTKIGAALVAACGLASVANAAFIQGEIEFTGLAVLDGPLDTATQVTSWPGVRVENATDDFDDYVTSEYESFGNGDAVVINAPWTFTSGLTPFWSVGGFTFDLDNSMIATQNSTFLNVKGSGTVTGNGFDATYGDWSFTIASTSNTGRFSFASSTSAVPDGGTTMALLGFSLLGLHGVRRKFVNR